MHPTNRDQVGIAARRGRLSRSAVGTHRVLFVGEGERRCDVCDAVVSAERSDEGGSGLYVWTRGEEVRYEEPPLCVKCGPAIALSALRRWEEEDEEEG